MIKNHCRQKANTLQNRIRIRQSGEYSEKVYEPVSVTEYNGGTLYEFETELNAVLEAEFKRIPAGADLLWRVKGRSN